jgi:sugar/nucleoside kinase (ribokinase family)
MTLTVIGHLCLDNVHLPGNRIHQSYGGIAYSLATLAALAGERDEIVPVFGVGEKDRPKFLEWLSRYPAIRTEGIFTLTGPTNDVHLFYEESGDGRIECSNHISPAIPFEKIKPFLKCDGMLINMISGFDITLETLDFIRMEVRESGTPIHFDFHSLTLGVGAENKRFRRPLSDWRRWCFMLHSIQMSEREAKGLTAERFNEENLINQLMPLMVNALVITRGDRGATMVEQHQKKLKRHDEPAVAISGTVDSTGCGDVFGAAFLLDAVRSKDLSHAFRFANRAAAFNAMNSGPEALDSLASHLTTPSAVS